MFCVFSYIVAPKRERGKGKNYYSMDKLEQKSEKFSINYSRNVKMKKKIANNQDEQQSE